MQSTPQVRSHVFIRGVRLLLFLGSFSLVVIGVASKRGLLDLRRIIHENEGLNIKLASIELQKSELQGQIQRFEGDPEERERVVRQVLGYIRSNETVIEFE